MTRRAALIVSPDPLAAALLGAAVELAGHTPHFLRAGEAARAALVRLRPRLVLVDCDDEDGCTEAFIGPAMMLGGVVILFRSPRTTRDVRAMAERLGVRMLDMPTESAGLVRLIGDTLADPAR